MLPNSFLCLALWFSEHFHVRDAILSPEQNYALRRAPFLLPFETLGTDARMVKEVMTNPPLGGDQAEAMWSHTEALLLVSLLCSV